MFVQRSICRQKNADILLEIEEEGLGLRHVFFKCTVLPSEGEVEFRGGQGIESRKRQFFFQKPRKKRNEFVKKHV